MVSNSKFDFLVRLNGMQPRITFFRGGIDDTYHFDLGTKLLRV